MHSILKTKNLTKEQINKYKMTEREIYKNFDNLSNEELNTKINKNIYVKNVIMTTIIKRCSGKNKRHFFFSTYLAVPQPTLGHSWGDSLTNPMLITVLSTSSTRRSPGAS